MSEPTGGPPADNVFVEVLGDYGQSYAADFSGDDQGNKQLDEAIFGLFTETMTGLEVPDDDEELANALMGDAITKLMRQCFMAGMFYQYSFGESESSVPEDETMSLQFQVSPENATAMIMNLVSGVGVNLRLVVDRGPN
jgi:hypothetical protein